MSSQPQGEEEFSMPFETGEILAGKYEVLGLLGAGGMGFVVSATHLDLGEAVALKFLRPEALANEEIVARFAREARAAARIQSEYVARVFDVGNLPDGAPFIVMEHLDGKDLSDLVRNQGPLPVKLAVEYFLQACEALASAHAHGIVHRDVKPENLFLTHRVQGMDIIKVLDFGISKVALTGSAFESKLPMVRTVTVMGSPLYMSPEQIRASTDIDARTDIWSLGCVLYELLSGQAAFDAPSLTQLSATILENSPTPLRSLCPSVPPEVEAIISRCIEKDPKKRFQNVGELAVALYPFGPRRARISAERCCYVLKAAGISQAEFELPSMQPPSWNGSNSGISIPLQVDDSFRASNGPKSTSFPDLPTVRPKKTSRSAFLLGIALAMVAGGYGLWRQRGATGSVASDGIASSVAAPGGALRATSNPLAEPPAVELPEASVRTTASAVVSAAHPAIAVSSLPRSRPAPKPKASSAGRPPAASGELDVGF